MIFPSWLRGYIIMLHTVIRQVDTHLQVGIIKTNSGCLTHEAIFGNGDREILTFDRIRFAKPPVLSYMRGKSVCVFVPNEVSGNAFWEIKFIDHRKGHGVFAKRRQLTFLIDLGITAVTNEIGLLIEVSSKKRGIIVDSPRSNRMYSLKDHWVYFCNAPNSGTAVGATHEFWEYRNKNGSWSLFLKPLVKALEPGQEILVVYDWRNLI